MVSIPRPHLQFDDHSDRPISASPVSPKSWDESMLELSVGLSKICGSPTPSPSDGPLSPLQLVSPLLSPLHSPVKTRPKSSSTTKGYTGQQNEPSSRIHRHSSYTRPGGLTLTRATSSPAPFGRPLFVRHEETKHKLGEQLAQICRPKSPVSPLHRPVMLLPSPNESTNHPPIPENEIQFSPTTTTTTRQSPSAIQRSAALATSRRDSLKSGFRQRVMFTERDLHDVSVSVDCSRVLTVSAYCDGLCEILEEFVLPADARVNHLVCLADDDVLLIRERSRSLVSISCSQTSCHYLPIIMEDEVNAELKVVLHVASEFGFEDLSVRTVDENLIIAGCKGSVQQPLDNSEDEDEHSDASVNCESSSTVTTPRATEAPCDQSWWPCIQFKVCIELSDKVDNRSVTAILSKQNQLVVRAPLGPNARRYTF